MVVQRFPGLPRRHPGIVWRCVLLGLLAAGLLISCDSGGDTGTPPASPDPTDPRFVQQGITEVLSVPSNQGSSPLTNLPRWKVFSVMWR
jgi:hypothetical protein